MTDKSLSDVSALWNCRSSEDGELDICGVSGIIAACSVLVALFGR